MVSSCMNLGRKFLLPSMHKVLLNSINLLSSGKWWEVVTVHAVGAWILLYNISKSSKGKEDAKGLDSWKVPKAHLMLHLFISVKVVS